MSWIVSLVIAGMMVAGSSEAALNDVKNIAESVPPVVVESKACEQQQNQPVVESTPEPQENQIKQERFEQTYPLNPNGRVNLDNLNGEVIINAWDRNEVRVEALKTIDCDRPMTIEIQVEANPSLISIDTEYEHNTWVQSDKEKEKHKDKDGKTWSYSYGYGNRCRKAKVDFKLTVPRTARLDQIETVNGSIILNGMTDYVKASTVNGGLTARNLRGTVHVSSVNGTLDVDVDSLENVREVKVGMVNGAINLVLPSDIDATVKADTVNGAINNDFGLPVSKGQYVGRYLHGRLGGGSIPVKLDGVNGTINIRRRQDGRSPKPVTNLLNNKNDDWDKDEDWDEDKDDGQAVVTPLPPVQSQSPRSPRSPRTTPAPRPQPAPRAGVVVVPDIEVNIGEVLDEKTREEIRQATREAARAQREAAKELSKLDIDKEKLNTEIREGMAQAREEMAKARDYMRMEREFSRNFNTMVFAASDRETKSIGVEGKPNIKINANGGSVSIRGWDKAEVSYALVKRNSPGGRKVNTFFEKKGSDVTINVTGASAESPFRLEVFVPRQSNIQVKTDRVIRVEGVKGDLNLEGADNSIDVRDSEGNLTVASSTGNVRVIGFNGAVTAKTESGLLSLEGDFSKLATETVDGDTMLTLKNDASVTLEANTADVVFDGIKAECAGEETETSTVWNIGKGGAANYKLKTTAGGQITVRGLSNIRVTRNYLMLPEDVEIFS